MNLISSECLAEEGNFHSFILCQTKNIPLSQKLPFIVTTQKGKFPKTSLNEESYEDFQCNYSFDCINYIINGKKVILGEAAWIKPLLATKDAHHLKAYQIINFDSLELQNHLKFYFYCQKSTSFIQIVPKYLISPDCLLFENLDHITDTQFKILNLAEAQKSSKSFLLTHNEFAQQTFTFQSQYAIMSDTHFLRCFVRGHKPIASYIKKHERKEYVHIIEEDLLRNLKRLYPSASL